MNDKLIMLFKCCPYIHHVVDSECVRFKLRLQDYGIAFGTLDYFNNEFYLCKRISDEANAMSNENHYSTDILLCKDLAKFIELVHSKYNLPYNYGLLVADLETM